MAKVELTTYVNGMYETYIPAEDMRGGTDQFTNEYANKLWEEQKAFNTIDRLIGNRKVIQRKIDAARKRLKRIVIRLSIIEGNWNLA